ncbi:uncharacterized protein ACIGJ3_021227 [Trichechus inunguis]
MAAAPALRCVDLLAAGSGAARPPCGEVAAELGLREEGAGDRASLGGLTSESGGNRGVPARGLGPEARVTATPEYSSLRSPSWVAVAPGLHPRCPCCLAAPQPPSDRLFFKSL